MKSKIILENGETSAGRMFSGPCTGKTGRVIFDTRVVGYEKILTCPEYRDKIACLSYPLIGNYGISYQDTETDMLYPSGLVISESSSIYSNFRADLSLAEFIEGRGMPVLYGADTQHITAMLREKPGIRGLLSNGEHDDRKMMEAINGSVLSSGYVPPPACMPEVPAVQEDLRGKVIAVINLGLKKSEMKRLSGSGMSLNVVNLSSPGAEDDISRADGLYISSGPDSMALLEDACGISERFAGKMPVFGAGLGHLVVGRLLGSSVSVSMVNHYGVNHPVVDIETGKCFITEQMHSLVLEKKSLPGKTLKYSHLNDGTPEGLYDHEMKAMSVSFIPQEKHFEAFFSLIKE